MWKIIKLEDKWQQLKAFDCWIFNEVETREHLRKLRESERFKDEMKASMTFFKSAEDNNVLMSEMILDWQSVLLSLLAEWNPCSIQINSLSFRRLSWRTEPQDHFKLNHQTGCQTGCKRRENYCSEPILFSTVFVILFDVGWWLGLPPQHTHTPSQPPTPAPRHPSHHLSAKSA